MYNDDDNSAVPGSTGNDDCCGANNVGIVNFKANVPDDKDNLKTKNLTVQRIPKVDLKPDLVTQKLANIQIKPDGVNASR